MLAVNQAKVEKATGHTLQHLGGALLASLAVVGGRFYAFARRLRDERRWNSTVRELHRLSDHDLNDIGIRRGYLDLRDDELVKRLREGG